MNETVYMGIRSAADILGVSSLEYARKMLGEPDAREKCKEGVRYLYSPEHIEHARCEAAQRKSDKGKRSCYHCRKKFLPAELKSGICPDCYAWKITLNFACRGDCTKYAPEAGRLEKLKYAIQKMESQINLYYR